MVVGACRIGPGSEEELDEGQAGWPFGIAGIVESCSAATVSHVNCGFHKGVLQQALHTINSHFQREETKCHRTR